MCGGWRVGSTRHTLRHESLRARELDLYYPLARRIPVMERERARAPHTLTPPHTHTGDTQNTPNTHAVREPHMWLRDTFFNACVFYFTIFTSHPPGRGARGRAAPRAGGARAGRPPQYSVVPHIRRCLDARAPWPAKRTTVHADGVCLQRVVFLIPFVPRLARACHTSKRLGCSPRGAGRGDARG